MANYEINTDKILDTISENSKIPDKDEELIKEFVRQSHLNELSTQRIGKYLYQFHKLADEFCFTFHNADRKDIEDLIIKIKQYQDWSEGTKRDYKISVRMFYTTLSEEHKGEGDYPDKVDWIDTRRKWNQKDPEEILSKENIRSLAQAACNPRDRAILLALYESGCRIGEFQELKIKHLDFQDRLVKISVDGKTGSRRIPLFMSVPSIKRWLENHPDPDNPEAFLWIKRVTRSNPQPPNKPLHQATIRRKLRELAERAGIHKDVNPHAFRHARATHMANEMTMAQMRKYFGWSARSSVPSRYIHLSGRDVDEAVRDMYGIQNKKEDRNVLQVFNCPKCLERVSPADKYCENCQNNLKKASEQEEIQDILITFMDALSKENPHIKQKFKQVVQEEGAQEIFQ